MRRQIALLASLFLLAGLPPAAGQSSSITVASTTSTEQSGLFGYLLPRFTSKTGIAVKVLALGTGQALDVGRRGDADVVFVHDQTAEEEFVAQGFGVKRRLRADRAANRSGKNRWRQRYFGCAA